MRPLIQNIFAAKPNPIGIDFGTRCLRFAQLHKQNGRLKLQAAEERQVPAEAETNWNRRVEFLADTLREVFANGKFTGRQVVLGLPAAATSFAHLRMPKMEPAELAKTLPFELKGKLSISPAEAVVRHLIAGEVFIEQDPRDEVIVMATRREIVQSLIALTEKARLDVVGMNLELAAIVECFAQVYRRKDDATAVNCFLDLGADSSRVIMATGRQILFVRSLPIGAPRVEKAAPAPHISAVAAAEPTATEFEKFKQFGSAAASGETLADLDPTDAGLLPTAGTIDDRRRDLREFESAVALHCQQHDWAAEKIVEELILCRRYYESAFPGKAIDRLIFVGGGAADRNLCQDIARGIALPAQIGDPITRIENREIIDGPTKRPQPAWAVAVGLSMGG